MGRGLALLVDEDRAVAAMWRNHAAGASAETRLALFDHYRPFARRIALADARRMPHLGLERDDFVQLANEALLQALDRFDPAQGNRFEAFARLRIAGHIRNAAAKASEASAQYGYRRRAEAERLRSLKAAADPADKSPLEHLAEMAAQIALGFMLEARDTPDPDALPANDPSAYDTLAWRQLCHELSRRLALLPEKEAFVLERHYRQGQEFQQIAALMGLSKGRISQLHAQGLGRLRKQMTRLR